MISLFRILLISLFLEGCFLHADSLNLTKMKKLVEQEESFAYHYKNYILKNGKTFKKFVEGNEKVITTYDIEGAERKIKILNPFTNLAIDFNTEKNTIKGFDKINSLDIDAINYYYSNENRKYTKAPLVLNGDVEIILSTKEKFINDAKDKITNSKTGVSNKYYLDDKEVLHFYAASEKYKYSYDKEILLSKDVKIYCDKDMTGIGKECETQGDISANFKDITKGAMTLGMTVYRDTGSDNISSEHVVLGPNNVLEVTKENRDIGKTIIQFNRRAGGMIVNGDIYAWGNNGNKITGINKGYTGGETTGTRYPVITGIVPLRAKIYDVKDKDGNNIDFYSSNYFSSPNRPKFIDFFNSVFVGTCGISTKGELFCGGTTRSVSSDQYSDLSKTTAENNIELLYRSSYFNGSSDATKVKKIFANNAIWHILGQNGKVYLWGTNSSGFGGIVNKNGGMGSFSNNSSIPGLENVKDLTYLLTIGFRRMGAITNTGGIYIWGVEDYGSSSTSITTGSCSKKESSKEWANMCSPTRINKDTSNMQAEIAFESLKGGIDAFIAKDVSGKYYKISQVKDAKIKVELINEKIKDKTKFPLYDPKIDTEIISADVSRTISDLGTLSQPSNGIVWVNGKNQLKGDYFTTANKNDDLFQNAIDKIKWKQVKVIQDDNGMCGIDINDQMYCWGIQSFYRSGGSGIDPLGNTFMIPVFNTNLYDLDKDFLVAEGGGVSGSLTNLTSDPWTIPNSKGEFFMKYPTYIGGFNYEFEFK